MASLGAVRSFHEFREGSSTRGHSREAVCCLPQIRIHKHQSDARLLLPRSIRNWRAQSISPIGCVRLFNSCGFDGTNRPGLQSFPNQLPEYPAVSVVPHQKSLRSLVTKTP
jgi:hypothetical protein